MQLSTRHDVEMSADVLFDSIADFDRLERIMIRRGAKARRLEPSAGVPMAWDVQFGWRGRQRDMRMTVTRSDRPDAIEMTGTSDSFDVTMKGDVIALSRDRSRLILMVEVKPRTLKARLVLQTARLTRGSMERQFAQRVAAYVDGMINSKAA